MAYQALSQWGTAAGAYEQSTLRREKPDIFNGVVSIRRYRVTFEQIDEPVKDLIDRVVELWKNCDNMHHREPLRWVAAELGIEPRPDSRGWRYLDESPP